MSTLTPTQIEVLTAAADRPDGRVHPLPARLPSGAQKKVLASLLSRHLVFETAVGDEIAYHLTVEGYAAADRQRVEAIGYFVPTSAIAGIRAGDGAIGDARLQCGHHIRESDSHRDGADCAHEIRHGLHGDAHFLAA